MFTDTAISNPVMADAPANGHAMDTAPATPECDPACKPVPPSLVLMSAAGPWLVRVDQSRDRIVMEGNGTTASVFPIHGWPACTCRERQGNRSVGLECVHVRLLRAVGLVSPELHLYFAEPLSAAQTAATGFFNVVTHRPTTAVQDRRVLSLFEQVGIGALAERPFARLSTGEQRLVLLIRALVKDPPLLVLDEPFQGLDERLVRQARQWLEERLRPEQSLIFVSHHWQEIPRTVHRLLRLDSGRVVEMR